MTRTPGGAAAAALLLAFPLLLAVRLRRAVPELARWRRDDEGDVFPPRGPWGRRLVGDGEWVSRTRGERFSFRYSSVLRPLREGAVAWVCCGGFTGADMALGLLMALLAAPRPVTFAECAHVRAA
eukprot:gene7678-66865_t